MARSSALPGAVGICATDISSVAAIVNEAQERLINDPLAPDEGFWGGWARMVFNVQVTNRVGYIVTPQEVARVIVMDVCTKPIKIRNGFYEFLNYGPGLQPKPNGTCQSINPPSASCCGLASPLQAYERETVTTLATQTVSPAILRVYMSDSADLGRGIVIQGDDQNGKVIYGIDTATKQAILGERVSFADPFSDSVNQFASISGIIKDVTVGPVIINQVDPDTGDETYLTTMDPHEVTAQYRKYLLNNLPVQCCTTSSGIIQVTSMVKLDFIPVKSDSDFLTIQSLPALIEEVQAIKYSRMDSEIAAKLEEKHHAKALSLLFGQLDHYLGKTQTAISVPIFGSNRLRAQPI